MLVMAAVTVGGLATLLFFFFRGPPSVGLTLLPTTPGTAMPSDRQGGSALVGFVALAEDSGVDVHHTSRGALADIRHATGAGVGLADLNGDGLIDLFLVASVVGPVGRQEVDDIICLNRGDLRFDCRPIGRGYGMDEFGMGCAIADYDADGDPDVYVTALGANRLLRNDGEARFVDVAAEAGVADPSWGAGAAFADYDGDGRLDLYVANYLRFNVADIPTQVAAAFDRDEPPAFSPYVFPPEADVLFHNNGDGTFSDATSAAGLSDSNGKGLGVAFADLNTDGRADLAVVNDVSPNAFWLNSGSGRFVDQSVISGLADPRSGMGIAVADYDEDGAFDLFSTHWQDESNVLYRNLSVTLGSADPPLFEDVTQAAGLAAPSIGSTGWGTCWGDFDHDGDLDLLVVNGYTSPAPSKPQQCIGQAAMLFMNERGRFTNRAAQHGLGPLSEAAGRGAATADLDDDGDLDLVVTTNNGPAFVFENRMAAGHWLKVAPRGGQAVGAVVRITSGGRRQQRILLAGSSYLSSEPLVAHFGLGETSTVERVEVHWPDGRVAALTNARADQMVEVAYPK